MFVYMPVHMATGLSPSPGMLARWATQRSSPSALSTIVVIIASSWPSRETVYSPVLTNSRVSRYCWNRLLRDTLRI